MTNKTIVIIEDNRLILQMTTLFLKGFGYKVRKFRSGIGIDEILKKEKCVPNLFIIDICLIPPEDGRNIYNTIRSETSVFKDVPILLCSSMQKRFVMDFKFNDCNEPHFLEKPFSREQLENKIKLLATT